MNFISGCIEEVSLEGLDGKLLLKPLLYAIFMVVVWFYCSPVASLAHFMLYVAFFSSFVYRLCKRSTSYILGITLDALWTRLAARKPQFSLPIDEHTKRFLWSKVLACNRDFKYYALKEARAPLVLFDRFQFTDPDSGIILEQVSTSDVHVLVNSPSWRKRFAVIE